MFLGTRKKRKKEKKNSKKKIKKHTKQKNGGEINFTDTDQKKSFLIQNFHFGTSPNPKPIISFIFTVS